MKILATGGAGYIGSSLVAFLLTRGHHVTVLDRFITPVLPFSPHARLRVLRGDVRDRVALQKAMPGADAVVHLAFVSNDPEYRLAPTIGESVNLEGTRATRDEALAAGVRRFIFMSSCSVYGNREGLVTEEDTPSPITDYAIHKLRCEEIVLSASRNGMDCVAIRPATLTGTSPNMRFDLLLNRMAAQAAARGVIEIPRPRAMRPVTSITDLNQAITSLVEANGTLPHGLRLNIASAERRIGDWAEWVGGMVGAKILPVDDRSTADLRSYSVSCRALQDLIGLKLDTDLMAPVKEVWRLAQRMCHTDPLNHPRHVRLLAQAAHDFNAHVVPERCL